ncbi:hypothetical protein [Tessaracoccus flavescens]|nr:hypothetical protein [Tessaracoccus flavescens]
MSRAIRLLLAMMLAVVVGLLTPVAARADDKTPITRFHATVE